MAFTTDHLPEPPPPIWVMRGDELTMIGACERNGHNYEVQPWSSNLGEHEYIVICRQCADCRKVTPV